MGIGLIIFFLVFYYLMLINWLLNKLAPSPVAQLVMPAPAAKEPSSPGPQVKHYLHNLAGLALVILAIPVTMHLSQTQPVPLPRNFDLFPLNIGPWEGKRSYLEPAVLKILKTDEYLEANYVNSKDGPVSLWIAYYPNHYSQKGIQHNPEMCMAGGGRKAVQNRQTELAPGLNVNYLLVEQSGVRQVVYYWYLQSSRWVASELSLKMYLGLDALLKKRNDGALVRLVTPATPSVEQAQGRLRAFGQYLIPALQQFFQLDENFRAATGKKELLGKKDQG